MAENIHDLISVTQQEILDPLAANLEDQQNIIIDKLETAFHELHLLSGFFNQVPSTLKKLDDGARNSIIWQQPKPNLQSPKVTML